MDMDKLAVAIGVGMLVFMIFFTDKWKAVNNECYRNLDETGRRAKTVGKAAVTAGKVGMSLFKMFKKR